MECADASDAHAGPTRRRSRGLRPRYRPFLSRHWAEDHARECAARRPRAGFAALRPAGDRGRHRSPARRLERGTSRASVRVMMRRDKHKISITILICDNDADNRMITQQALEGARISNELRFVANGEQLLNYLYQRGPYAGETGAAPRPGLILLNLNMPTMDVHEALRHIKQDPTLLDIHVVALTTSALDANVI